MSLSNGRTRLEPIYSTGSPKPVMYLKRPAFTDAGLLVRIPGPPLPPMPSELYFCCSCYRKTQVYADLQEWRMPACGHCWSTNIVTMAELDEKTKPR